MTQTLRFLLAFEVLGLIGAPLAARALGRLPGAGVGLAKILGWLIAAWLVWMLGSLGLPHTTVLVVICVVALAALAWWLQRRRSREGRDPFASRLFVACELLFGLTFAASVVLGSHAPASDVWGTEKPMDMMFINATLADDDLPPHDPWLAGTEVNYYYLGHHMVGMLIRLTGVEPSEGYNLALAGMMAIAITTAFGLAATVAEAARRQGMQIRRPLLAGGLCVLLLVLMGSWNAGWAALHADSIKTFDWFGPTRVIPDAINEFPFASWIVGDLHAHYFALPLTLLGLAFVVQAGLHGPPRLASAETLCAALAIAWLYAVNSWSWPVMVGVLVVAAGVWISTPTAAGRRLRAVGWTAGVVALGVLLILPFVLNFDPNVNDREGSFLAFTKEAQRHGTFTYVRHHFDQEGALLWLLVAPLLARLVAARYSWRIVIWGLAGVGLLLAVLSPQNLGGAVLTTALLVGTLAAAVSRRLRTSERMLWVLAAGGVACILGAELGVVKDEFYGGQFERMNTVFKMGYQAWILLAVFGAVALAGAREWVPSRLPRAGWAAIAAVLVGVGLAYTVAATYSRMGAFANDTRLDGRVWLAEGQSAAGDIAAIDWIREELPGDAVILEGFGDDYSPFPNTRISTFTGRPTVIGWQGHELQWSHDVARPAGDDPRPLRRDDIQLLYTSKDEPAVRDLIDVYEIDYAVIGPYERTTYGESGVIGRLGETVFNEQGTRIVKLT